MTTEEKQKKVEFHNVVAWRRLGEICAQYLRKGNKVYVEGRLQTRDWEGQDGVKRYRTEIIAENMIMLEAKGTNSASGEPAPPPPTDNEGVQPEPPSGEDEIKVEDIPF